MPSKVRRFVKQSVPILCKPNTYILPPPKLRPIRYCRLNPITSFHFPNQLCGSMRSPLPNPTNQCLDCESHVSCTITEEIQSHFRSSNCLVWGLWIDLHDLWSIVLPLKIKVFTRAPGVIERLIGIRELRTEIHSIALSGCWPRPYLSYLKLHGTNWFQWKTYLCKNNSVGTTLCKWQSTNISSGHCIRAAEWPQFLPLQPQILIQPSYLCLSTILTTWSVCSVGIQLHHAV